MTTTRFLRSSVLLASAALAFAQFPAHSALGAWVAYHDIAGTSHTPVPNTTSQTTADAAIPLVQFTNGNSTGVAVTIDSGARDGRGPTATFAPAPGTLGDTLFASSGLDLANGLLASRFDRDGPMTFTFTGLNPDRMYSVALYGHRNLAADGLDRFTLSGVDSANNLSSGTISGLSADFHTRQNDFPPGDSAYFTDIAPGADGTMVLTASGQTGSNIVYINGLRLEDTSPAAAPLNGTPIYRETFGNASGSDQGLSYADWVGYYGSSATQLPDTGPLRGDITALAGASTTLGPINSDPDSNEPDNGVGATGFGRLLWPSGGGVSPALVYTDEFTVNRSLFAIDTIRWDQAVDGGTDSFRAAVEIDDNWYVSDEAFTGPNNGSSGTFGANATEMSLDFELATWRSLDFTPDAALGSPGGFVTLPGGDITAFGLYGSYNRTMWFDTFTIEAAIIPEPSQFALALVGFITLIGLRPRRRRARS